MSYARQLALLSGALLAPDLLHAATCGAGTLPQHVVEIRFEGNEVTRRDTLMRELAFTEGDRVCPAELERGRQALLDLRLFRGVELRTQPLAPAPERGEGAGYVEAATDKPSVHASLAADRALPRQDAERVIGQRVTYRVRERWYLLPIPRIDANSDETFGLGVSLGWNNIGGRNHRLSMGVVRREVEERTLDSETIVSGTYNWRRFGGSRTNVSLRGDYREESAVDGERHFKDQQTSFGIGASRQLTSQQTGQGWSVGGGLDWQRGRNSGPQAPPDEGEMLATSFGVSYADLHSSVYSERGFRANVGVQASVPTFSDYDQFNMGGSVLRIQPLGNTAHQRLRLRASVGSFHGGPKVRRSDAYNLGGASVLRGYDNEFGEGEAFWAVGAEFLRPVVWDWLRLLVALEAGQVHRARFAERDQGLMASIGVGFRVRFTWFVDAEFELGVAYPLRGGDGMRGFAGGV